MSRFRVLTIPILLLASASLLAMGCAFGTRNRIYATSGNDIALTRYDAASKAAGTCAKWKEADYLVELAGGGKAPAKDAACVSFEIHEDISFSDAKSIDVQEYLRQEFGSGYRFGDVSVKLEIGVWNWLLNVATLGIANSQTIVITGDRYPLALASSSQ